MARAATGPLTEADYRKINEALASLENTHSEVQRAMNAGLDCSQENAACNDLKARLNQIKGVYFPQLP